MPKARGAGSITQLDKDKSRARCRRWQLRVFVGRDEGGKPHYKTRRFEGTYRQAVEQLRSFAASVESGQASGPNGRMTVEEYYRAFHEERAASGNYKPRSLKAEKNTMANFIDCLGRKRMVDVTASDVEKVYAKLRTEGGRSGKPLSQSSILQLHRYVKCMFNHAKKRGDVPPDSLRGLRPPKAGKPKKRSMTDAEAIKLSEELMKTRDARHVAVLLCLECGLRRSEALALRWSDVCDRMLMVEASMENDESTNIGTTKTESGQRKVAIGDRMWKFLTVWKWDQASFCEGCEFVCSDDGSPISPAALSCWWTREREKLGTDFCLHELRHTFATRLVRANANLKSVQIMLGHKRIATTMDVYAHVDDNDLFDAICLID